MVNALAPGSNTIPFTSVLDATEIFLVFDASKVAVSDGLFGTVSGVQFAAVFQSLLLGLRSQVALSARES
jgi:hypothetical protein